MAETEEMEEMSDGWKVHIADIIESDSDDSSSSSSSSSSSTSTCTEKEEEPTNEKITLKARKDKGEKGKWKLLSSNKKVFRKEFLDYYSSWIEEDPANCHMAYCKICKTYIKAIRGVLETHQKSKRHLRNCSPSESPEEILPKIEKVHERVDTKPAPGPAPTGAAFGIDQITDEQIGFFAESQADAAHQAVTSIIDKLVEKYHENRLSNLKVQNEAIFELNAERAKIVRTVNQKKLERRLQHEAYMKEAEDAHLKCLIAEHEAKIRAMEGERDAKLRAVEQELVFAKQEYERKVRLLDSQLSSMK